jgi:DNA adenine methylase
VAPRPVVKWAGGKSRLLNHLIEDLPRESFKRYAEPFCGGGAMFFRLAAEKRFKKAFLADKNPELVVLYQVIQKNVKALIKELAGVQKAHYALSSEDERSGHFYRMRDNTKGLSRVARAARFIFLNKTCFNGLWRVNASGRFNVPFGKYAKPRILDVEALEAAHEALQLAEIYEGDFSTILSELKPGDFAYFDPPYVPLSKTANFTAYAADRFGLDEQKRLANKLVDLRKSGVHAMLSNASTPEIRTVYETRGLFVHTIRASRSINSNPRKRGEVDELVVTTYEPAAAKTCERTVAS